MVGMKAYVAFSLLLLWVAPMLGAAGESENKSTAEPEKTLNLFLLAQNGGEAEMYVLDRMDLPAAVSLFEWTKFTLKGGEVSTETSRGYSQRSRSMVSRENSGGLRVIQYKVIILPSAGSKAATASLKVSFTVKECVNSKGEVLFQPERMAVMRAVQASTRASGYIRIAELEYLGEGRFSAAVELR
jgi:hypothetical protein